MHVRYHGLDFARSILMILGVVHHSAAVYQQDGDWRVVSEYQSRIFNLTTEAIHLFRMEAFYIIAGFFFLMLVERKGLSRVLRERLLRVALPMISVGFSLNFVMNALSANRVYDHSFAYVLRGQWLGHLWFLGNLIVYYLVTSTFLGAFRNVVRPDRPSRLYFGAMIVTPVLTTFLSLAGNMVTMETFVFVSFGSLWRYYSYFLLGMFLWQGKSVFFKMFTGANVAVLLSIFCLTKFMESSAADLNWSFVLLLRSISSTSLGLAAIVILGRIGNQPHRFVYELAQSSYTIYLVHMPLVLMVYTMLLLPLGVKAYAGFTVLTLMVFALSHACHVYLVNRSDWLLFLFNGRMVGRLSRR